MSKTLTRTAFFAIALCPTSALLANQLTNAGFELPATPTFATATAPDNATIPSWSVTAGSVDVVNAAGNGFDIGPAYEGAQYLDLNGATAGTLAQTFPTTPGQRYLLEFAYANNYNPPTSLTAHVLVTDPSGTLLDTTVTHGSSAAGNLDWTLSDNFFTATSSSATLTFVSQAAGNGGVFLDALSVAPAVPEPTLVGLAMFATLPLLRRR